MAGAAARSDRRLVEAAGAVVWRPAAHERAEVLLVHRPKYDDWSFPKGKLLPDELAPAAAVREVLEETAVSITLGPPLPPVRYRLASGADKLVRYWSAVAIGPTSEFTANAEVDERGWFGLRDAARQLTHPHDRALLATLTLIPTRALVVVRHARAVDRDQWPGDDTDRPLDETGIRQAGRLSLALSAYGITRVVSSDARRCVDTVRPYATRHGLEIEADPAFSEEAVPDLVRDHTGRLLGGAEPTVVCTHRPTMPTVVETLGIVPVVLHPAELVVAHLDGGSPVGVERLSAG